MKFSFFFAFIVLSLSQTTPASANSLKDKKPVADWTISGNVTLNANYTVTSGSNLYINNGATLTIPNGITLTNSSGGFSGIWNNGTIIIENGGTFTNNGDFHNNEVGSSVTINGALSNTGFIYDCKLNVSGTVSNNNQIIIAGNSFSPSTVNNSGVFNNLSDGIMLASYLALDAGGSLVNTGKLYGNINFSGGG